MARRHDFKSQTESGDAATSRSHSRQRRDLADVAKITFYIVDWNIEKLGVR